MNKKYKLSKYNFYCEDQKENLLLCNFAIGPKSFSCVEKEYVNTFKSLILDNKIIEYNNANKSIVNQLKDIGFLAEVNENENSYYDALFYQKVYNTTMMLIIMPTHKCNFKCKYCYEDDIFASKEDMTHDAQVRLLRYIQKNIVNYPKLKISWFGGEPLIALNSIEYLSNKITKICEARKIAYESEITTNAYCLTPSVFDMLYKYKIYSYQITLDGTKEQHDSQRIRAYGLGTFDTILDNLLYIKNHPKYKLAYICIRVNVTKGILDHIKDFLDFYKQNFASDNRFSLRLVAAKNYNEKNIDSVDKNHSSEVEYIDKNKLMEEIYASEYINDIYKFDDIIRMFIPTSGLCYAAKKNSFVIDSELSVYKCTVHFNMEENKIGYINQNGDMIIDDQLHKKWYVRSDIPETCFNCFYLPCCNKGDCPVFYNNINQGEFNSYCHVSNLKNQIKKNILLLNNMMQFKKIIF